jgi:hypothetical protein
MYVCPICHGKGIVTDRRDPDRPRLTCDLCRGLGSITESQATERAPLPRPQNTGMAIGGPAQGHTLSSAFTKITVPVVENGLRVGLYEWVKDSWFFMGSEEPKKYFTGS